MGTNPIFLATVHDAMQWGYVPKRFASWLWNAYRGVRHKDEEYPPTPMNDQQQALVLCTVFPELVDDKIK